MEASNDIWTVDDLVDILEEDKENGDTQILLERLHEATCDWPTMNQMKVDEFIQELEQYYGLPITSENIRRRKFDGNNAWNLEAGENIALMLDASTRLYGEETFNEVINRLKHYVIEWKQRHANNR